MMAKKLTPSEIAKLLRRKGSTVEERDDGGEVKYSARLTVELTRSITDASSSPIERAFARTAPANALSSCHSLFPVVAVPVGRSVREGPGGADHAIATARPGTGSLAIFATLAHAQGMMSFTRRVAGHDRGDDRPRERRIVPYSKKFEDAFLYASELHRKQVRKETSIPT